MAMTEPIDNTVVDGRHWKISVLVGFPKLVVPIEPPEPGSFLPKKIGFQSRLTEKHLGTVAGLGKVALKPNPYTTLTLPAESNSDVVVISFEAHAGTPELALTKTESSLELLLDDMSFQIQAAIRALMLEVLDVTPPLMTGEEREVLLYPFPIGWPYPKFQESRFLSDATTPKVPSLRAAEGFEHGRTRAALRWYVKALATPFDVDRFAFLWIALEILCSASSSSVEKPYKAPCGHEIGSCPQCGKSTSKEVQGPTLISFLAEELCVQSATAKELWKTRQMFHGTNDLTKQAMTTLPALLVTLKSAVARGLKAAGKLPPFSLPHVAPGSIGVSKEIALGGTRKLEPKDLDDL